MRIALVLLVMFAGVAQAGIHKSKAGKVSVSIPKPWKVVGPTDELVRAASPKNDVAVVMWIVDSPDVPNALQKLEGELYSSVKSLQWVKDSFKQVKVNKLDATWVEGIGVSGRATSLDIIVLVAGPTATKKGVILMAVVEHDKLAANRKTIQSIFGTLKPTR